MKIDRLRALSVVAGAVLVVSCNETTAPLPEPDLDDALEELAAAEGVNATGTAMMGGISAPPAGAPAPCVYNSGNQRFECPAITMEGLTMTRYYQLLDASGAAQSAWGTNVVAVKHVMDASGTRTISLNQQQLTTTMTSHDESTISGLRSETRTLTGSGTSTFTTTSAQGSNTSNMTRTTNLTLPRPAPDAYPTGTSTMTMTVPGSSAPVMTMTMTYDGTSVVKMTSTFGTTTRTCTMDLKSPQTQPVCSS